jgi:uncharacterized membrane protein YuzA (DUF378 family)
MGIDINYITVLLLIIGGLNWGSIGLLGKDLVALIAGRGTVLARAIYTAVGLSAVLVALKFFRITEGFENKKKDKKKNEKKATASASATQAK